MCPITRPQRELELSRGRAHCPRHAQHFQEPTKMHRFNIRRKKPHSRLQRKVFICFFLSHVCRYAHKQITGCIHTFLGLPAGGGGLSLREDQYLPGPGLPWLQIWYLPLQDPLSTVHSQLPSRWVSARYHCRTSGIAGDTLYNQLKATETRRPFRYFFFRHIIELFSALEYLYSPGLLHCRGTVS